MMLMKFRGWNWRAGGMGMLAVLILGGLPVQAQDVATGSVYHDANENGARDEGEAGIPDVLVSNGEDVVTTDADGAWSLPVGNDTTLFVIKPSGWMTPVREDMIPQFYYVHKPEGSPELRYKGLDPTGPLPESIDFPLMPQEEPDSYEFILFGDTQPRNQREIDYIAHDVVEELVGKEAAFGITLGDVLFDNLTLFEALNDAVAHIGLPWYNIVGNHDLNMDVPDNELATETWKRVYGPTHYAYQYGSTWYIALNDVVWTGDGYHGAIGETQLVFVENVLEHVAPDSLIVFLMHIPLTHMQDRAALYALIEDYPNLFSTSAHRHFQQHHFFGEDEDWNGAEPLHHLVHATVCGSWWRGIPNEFGIPHATMQDGAPNGYSIVSVDGNEYSIRFKAARRPADFQMLIHLPEAIQSADTGETEVVANIFAGSERNEVHMRLNGQGEWLSLAHSPRECPFFAEAFALDAKLPEGTGIRLPGPITSDHIWAAKLPADLPVGVHRVDVRSVDMFGQEHMDHRTFRVVD